METQTKQTSDRWIMDVLNNNFHLYLQLYVPLLFIFPLFLSVTINLLLIES